MSEEQPQAVTGATTTSRTLVDGTLRVSVDVEPRHAQAAFAMFGAPGTPVALARLTPEAAQDADHRTTYEHTGEPVLNAQMPANPPRAESWGHLYTALWVRGWWHNPRVAAAYGVQTDNAAERVERIKQSIYDEFDLESLSELEPQYLVASCDQMGIKDTLPPSIIEAARGRAI